MPRSRLALSRNCGRGMPHITIGRCRDVSAQTLRPFLQAHADFDAGMMHVDSFVLNSSLLMPGGSVYTRELVVAA